MLYLYFKTVASGPLSCGAYPDLGKTSPGIYDVNMPSNSSKLTKVSNNKSVKKEGFNFQFDLLFL